MVSDRNQICSGGEWYGSRKNIRGNTVEKGHYQSTVGAAGIAALVTGGLGLFSRAEAKGGPDRKQMGPGNDRRTGL